ncbi:MAG: hypothetical protein HY830_24315, partial [Actinobacteria bacterium]|nr:hypothetical protein [Actinomycetota bacterium]
TSGAASVAADGDVLSVVRPGDDALDLLRAGCVAAGTVVDAGRAPDVTAVLRALAALEPEAAWAR